jgi:hypothetical protein
VALTGTVVIPARNEEDWIAGAIESVLTGQAAADILVVDDGSEDRTIEIAARYDRVTVVPCVGQGIVDVNNTALVAARGEIMIHLDADDRLLPGAVEALVTAFIDPDVVLVGGSTVIDDGSRMIDSDVVFPTHRHLALAATVVNPFSHTGTALRREHVLAVGGYRAGGGGVPWGEDGDLWVRILSSGGKSAGIAQTVARRTLRPGGITAVHHQLIHERSSRARAEYRAGVTLPGFPDLISLGEELRASGRADVLQERWSVMLLMLANQLAHDGRHKDSAIVAAAAVRSGPRRLVRGLSEHQRRMRRRRRVRTREHRHRTTRTLRTRNR